MSIITEKLIIHFCLRNIEKTFGHGPCSEWSHHHFSLLSEDIEKKNRVIISETTLKRLFGKRTTEPDYIPQIGTRDALSQYVGFRDWQDLTLAATENIEVKDPGGKNINQYKRIYSSLSYRFAATFVFILLIGFSAYYFIGKGNQNKIPEYQINVRNPIDTIPFTAIFNYKVPLNIKDTFFLQIPEFRSYSLSPDNQIYTHWFNYAGLFPATLKWNDSVLDTIVIHAQNSYWQPGITQYEPVKHFQPFYQSDIDPTENGLLYLSPSTIQRNGIDTLTNYWTEFRLFQAFNVRLDDCTITTTARNNSFTGGKPCYDIEIELIGENGRIRVVFIDQRCFRFAQLTIGEFSYDGRNHDLSMLAVDLKKWTSFQIKVEDKLASIIIKDREVFQQKYSSTIGQLKGIIFRFFGSGQASDFKIQNGAGKVIFLDSFD